MPESFYSIVGHLVPVGTGIVAVDACKWMSSTDQLILFALDEHDCIQLVSSIDVYDEVNRNMVEKYKNRKNPSKDPNASANRAMNKLMQYKGTIWNSNYNKNPKLDFQFSKKDVHVVALAIASIAKEILTSDKHFLAAQPKSDLNKHLGIHALDSDELYSDILKKDQTRSLQAFKSLKYNLSLSNDELIGKIDNFGLKLTSSELKKHRNML